METIGITGGRGMLGSDIKELAEKQGYKINIYDLPEYDLTIDDNLEKIVSENDIIINCAAYTAVDKAESEEEICHKVNAEVPKKLGSIAKAQNKYIIHISTDFVFGDDADSLLNEESPLNPLSVYGSTKLEGEKNLTASGCKNAIIRVQWTYGVHGNHFVAKIIELAEKMPELKVVDDQYGAPTPTTSVAQAILCFIKNKTEGLYHFAANGYASRYDVAKVIFKEKKINIPLTPCSSSFFSSPAKRPVNSRFDCSKIDKVIDFTRPEWDKALKDFLH
jgi:dTDP-4-dehydrorhamnose reductase